MSTLAKLVVELGLDSSQFSSGIEDAQGRANGFASSLGGIAKATAAIGVAGIVGAGAALFGAAHEGLAFNNSMEQVTAQLNAFTKDGQKTADLLTMIKDRASKTPFAFEEMATATAALYPAARASGQQIEKLIAQAEILAASNPAQGLEGAAFALKEALSGDFTSIIERFNLPRQRLNELKDQGVPALEAVQTAMQELGLDASLVGNLAETATGRWSTFKDTLTGVFAQITKPIFDTFSQGLARVNELITANQPLIDAFAASMAGHVGAAIDYVSTTAIPGLISAWESIQPTLTAVSEAFSVVRNNIIAVGESQILAQISTTIQPLITSVQAFGASLLATFVDARTPIEGFLDVLSRVSPVFDIIRTAVETSLPVIMQIVQQVFGFIQTFIDQHGADIANTIQHAWTKIQTIIQTASQLVSGIVLGMTIVIRDFLAAHGTQIQQILSAAWTIIKNVVLGALEIIQGILSAALAIFKGDWQGAWETIQTMSIGVVARLKSIIEGGLEIIAAFFDTSLTEIANTWKHNFEMLPVLAGAIVGKLITVGTALVEGLKAGFASAWGRFTGWIESKINEIPQVVRDVLGIHSPSTVFAEIGMQSVTGIQAGWDKLMPALQAALGLDMSKLNEKLRKGVQDWLQHVSDMFKSQASLARSMYTTFGFLRDFEKATKSQELQDAQNKYNNSREKLLSINEKLAENEFKMRDLAAETALTTEEHNKRANELTQERNALLNEQAHATNDIRDASIAQDQAQAKANQQQAQLALLADNVRKQYQALENQVNQLSQTDAKAALDTYNLRSKQIQELAELQKQLIATSDPTERSALETQIRLLQATQGLETQAAQTEINLYARDAVLGMEEIVRLINEAFQRAGISADIRLRVQ